MPENPSDKLRNADPLVTGALGTAGVAGLVKYLKERQNVPNDVLFTYGAADPLGGGHKAPAQNMLKLLQNDHRFDDFRFHEAPMGQSGVLVSDPSALNRKYLASLDTHWGLTDPAYRNEYIDFLTSRRPAGSLGISDKLNIEGTGNVTGNSRLLENKGRTVLFQPDPPDLNIRNKLEGMLASTDPVPNVEQATYGTPSTTAGKMRLFGEIHPGVDYDAVSGPMKRVEYLDTLNTYLGRTVDPAVDWKKVIGDKKIITVSGATRGDSVGIRVRRIHDALKDAGMLDKYFIVGLGAKGQKIESEIAKHGRPLTNAVVGGFAPSTKIFVDIANNSDLHHMGMGGATPMEMLAHGGAPIIFDKNEQMYVPNRKGQWVYGGGLLKGQGLFGEERRVINKMLRDETLPADTRETLTQLLKSEAVQKEELQRALKNAVDKGYSGEVVAALRERVKNALPENARPWMNPEYYKGGPSDYYPVSGGLDFNRNMLNQRYGIPEVEVPTRKVGIPAVFGTKNDPILASILEATEKPDLAKWTGISKDIRTRGAEAQEVFKMEFLKVLQGERNKRKLKTLLKYGLPGAALAAGAVPEVREGLASSVKGGVGKINEYLEDTTGLDSPGVVLGGVGAAGVGTSAALSGALSMRYGQQLKDITKELQVNNTLAHDPKKLTDLFQRYSDIMKKMQRLPFLGVAPVGTVTRAFSPGLLTKNTGLELRHRLSKLLPESFLSKLSPDNALYMTDAEKTLAKDFEEHYRGFRTNPEATLTSELFHKSLSTKLPRPIEEVLTDRSLRLFLSERGVPVSSGATRKELLNKATSLGVNTVADLFSPEELKVMQEGSTLSERLKPFVGRKSMFRQDVLRSLAKNLLGPSSNAAATGYGNIARTLGKAHIAGGSALAAVGTLAAVRAYRKKNQENTANAPRR